MHHCFGRSSILFMCLSIGIFVRPVATFAATEAKSSINVAAGSSVVGYIKILKSGFEAQSNTKLEVLRDDGMGADNVVVALDQGKADLGMIGTSWEDASKLFAERKTAIKDLKLFQTKTVGKDLVLFATYNGGPKELSEEQLRNVLSGSVTNWKDVGGEDTPVQIVVHGNSPATQKLISQKLLGGAEIYRKGIKIINSFPELIKFVGKTKGAITFCPSSVPHGDVNVLKTWQLARPIVAITLGSPKAEVASFIDYFEKNNK